MRTPLLNRFHKREPYLPSDKQDKQDKRVVVPLEIGEFRAWLTGSNEEAATVASNASRTNVNGTPGIAL